MSKDFIFEKLVRYVKGLSDDSEKKWVENQFLTAEENPDIRSFLEEDWNLLVKNPEVSELNLNHLLDRVHHLIRKKEIAERQKPVKKILRIYLKAAAILLIPLIISGGLIYSYLAYKGEIINNQVTNSTIYAPMGSRVSFNLPDGTSGMLNSGSHLSYTIPFNKNRQVTLDGEAWFDVNRDEKHPFEISAGTAVVRVLGTSFNLSAYPVENYIELVLVKGEVEFNALKGDKPVIIMPSERLVLENGIISKSVTEPAKFRAWTEGKLVFRGDPMTEVARRIERWYNVKIVLANPALEKYSFRATFQDDSLDEVLKFLSMTSPITFKITPRELLKDGTFKKEEITIYLK